MKFKYLCLVFVVVFYANEVFGQEIFKNIIKDYLIVLSKNRKNFFELKVTRQKKTLLNRSFPSVKLYFYNLDNKTEDEMVVVYSQIKDSDTSNTLLVFTFEDKFNLCDSLNLGRYFPEFYQFDIEGNYFIKTYEIEIEKLFPSTRTELPFYFYYLNDCSLVIDNEYSFEEYEAEIDYLVDEIFDLKRIINCEDGDLKNDFQRLLACLYVNLINSSKSYDFENFLKKNYDCNDLEILLKKLNSIFGGEENIK